MGPGWRPGAGIRCSAMNHKRFVLLPREAEPSGIYRIHRLYREEGLC